MLKKIFPYCSPLASFSLGGNTSGPKLNGNNSPIVRTIYPPSRLNMKIGVSSSRNSRRNCRHMPHGEQCSFMSVATATARNEPRVYPECTAVPNATRSAHVPTGYEAFSTLAPVMTVVVEAEAEAEAEEGRGWTRSEAPTRKRE